jgi:hypothetical protein
LREHELFWNWLIFYLLSVSKCVYSSVTIELTQKIYSIFVILVQNRVEFIFPYTIKNRKNRRTVQEIFFCHVMDFVWNTLVPPEIWSWRDHESVSNFDQSSIGEELSVYFRYTSGKLKISNCLKVKSELCFPQFPLIKANLN